MPLTLIGWTASQDSATLLALAALNDNHVRVESTNNIIIPEALPFIVAAYGLGVNITRAQFVSPSLRSFVNFELDQLNVSALPTAPTPVHDLRSDPVELQPDEQLQVQASENGAGATRHSVLAWLADGAAQPIDGVIRSVRITAAFTAAANLWTPGAITLDQNLPAGTYQLVGARLESTNLQAFRFVFVGGIWRPGAIGYSGPGVAEHPMFRYGGMGVWGEFRHNLPPQIEVLCNGADAAFAGVLDLVKL